MAADEDGDREQQVVQGSRHGPDYWALRPRRPAWRTGPVVASQERLMTTAVSDLQSAGHSHERRRLAALLSGGGPQPLADPVLAQLLAPLPAHFAPLPTVIHGALRFGTHLHA